MTIWERWERAMSKIDDDPILRAALNDIFFDGASVRTAVKQNPGVSKSTLHRRLQQIRTDIGVLPASVEIDLLEKRLLADIHNTMTKIRRVVLTDEKDK